MKQYVNSKGWQHIQPEITNDTITIGLSDYNLDLLLTSLNILIKDNIDDFKIQKLDEIMSKYRTEKNDSINGARKL